MPDTDICKEKYIDGKLVSRVCIKGNLFFLKDEFRPPTYELSEVSSPALCPVYPPATAGIDEEKIKYIAKEIAKEIVSDHLHRYHHHHHQDDHDN
jgi:hypothetical protein